VATVQLFTDYLTRLMPLREFVKRAVPMHDDLFDFFYQALPATKRWAAPHPPRLLGVVPGPEFCNFNYKDMTQWGRKMSSPRAGVDGKLVIPTWSRSTSASASCSPLVYEDWAGKEMFVTKTAEGPGGRPPPLETSTPSDAAEADFRRQLHLGDVARWYDGKDIWRCDTGGGRWRACGPRPWRAWWTSGT